MKENSPLTSESREPRSVCGEPLIPCNMNMEQQSFYFHPETDSSHPNLTKMKRPLRHKFTVQYLSSKNKGVCFHDMFQMHTTKEGREKGIAFYIERCIVM